VQSGGSGKGKMADHARTLSMPEVPVTRVAVVCSDAAHAGEVVEFLESVGIVPLIFDRRRSAPAKYKAESTETPFVVVVMTPDEMGGRPGATFQSRATQDTVATLGYFVGKLGPSKVCALVAANVQRPVDFDETVYVDYGSKTAWKQALVGRLQGAAVPLR
jgi:predicted nucleotide-binding protein